MFTLRTRNLLPNPFHRPHGVALLLASLLSVVALVSPVDGALAPVSEEVIRTRVLASFPDPRIETESHLTFTAACSWSIDPDGEIVTLEVHRGVLDVTLMAGSARIDRHAAWLASTARQPLEPGMSMTLMQGDRLVVLRGYLLTITNRHEAEASAQVLRLRYQ